MFDYNPQTEILGLKCLPSDGKAYGGFQWDTTVGAVTTAPDWSPTKKCGNGLHAWTGHYIDLYATNPENLLWLVVALPSAEVVDLKGKVKAPWARVLMAGERRKVCTAIAKAVPWAVPFAVLTGGKGAVLTGGHYAKLTGGEGAVLTGGHYAKLTGGDRATLTGGHAATFHVKGSNVAVIFLGENNRLVLLYPEEGTWRAEGNILVQVEA